MKGVLARENEKLSTQDWQAADPALFTWLHNRVPHVKRLDLCLDLIRRVRRNVHFLLQRVNVSGVFLQSVANFFFEVIDNNKVREERDQVLNFKQVALPEESNGSFDARILSNLLFRYEQP